MIELERAHAVQLEAPTSDWAKPVRRDSAAGSSVKINNIDAGRTDLLQWLDQAGVPHVIDQFEMEMALSKEGGDLIFWDYRTSTMPPDRARRTPDRCCSEGTDPH